MAIILIDFETRSDVDLISRGAENYFRGKQADIVFLSYQKVNEKFQPLEPVKQWFPGDPLPNFTLDTKGHTFYAFNALFEARCWNYIGCEKYNFHPLDLTQLVDVQAICSRFTFPSSLAEAGKVLKLNVQKDTRGKQLIKRICTPPFQYTSQEFEEFKEYGKTDIETMREMILALPAVKLSQKEQQIWILTQKINLTGLPIDYKTVKLVYDITEAYKEQTNLLLPELTNGQVTKATQRDRIVRWLRSKGVNIPDLQAATVEKYLQKDIPEDCKFVLSLRQELGRSSTAKYKKILDLEYKGRVYDNLMYYGAGKTGRWGGRGFQIHNLPRSNVKNAEEIIKKFEDYSIIEDNPIKAAKDIIRSLIKAPPGKALCFADYSSIENRALAWCAGDDITVKLFYKGLDQYKDMASYVFQVPYEQVTKDMRQIGKILVLGCGYGLGWKAFIEQAQSWGVKLTDEQAQFYVKAYRDKYNKVVKFWYACRDAALNALAYPGKEFSVHKVIYKLVKDKNNHRWLVCTLPSGRNLYYYEPTIKEGVHGPELAAYGINPYNKKWQLLRIVPGRLVENIIQAFCRDILAEGKLNLDKAGFKIIASVHDEVILEVDEGFNDIEQVYKLMCTTPDWAKGLPLAAEGVIEKRYRKM